MNPTSDFGAAPYLPHLSLTRAHNFSGAKSPSMLLMSKRTPSFEPWHVFTACRCPSLANGYPPSNPATFSLVDGSVTSVRLFLESLDLATRPPNTQCLPLTQQLFGSVCSRYQRIPLAVVSAPLKKSLSSGA